MAPNGPTDSTRSGLHWMVLDLPGGGRGGHQRPLPHASRREGLSVRAVRPFHSATSHRRSRVTTALTELPTLSRAVGVANTSRACYPQPVAAREAAQPSQEGAARGPSGACRAAARRVGVIEGGPLARATVRVSGGYSLPDARGSRSRSRTCSPWPDYPGDGAVRPHGPPTFAEQMARRARSTLPMVEW